MKRHTWTRRGLAAATALLLSGCLFTAKHELPPNAVFGKLPRGPAAKVEHFEDDSMKNWALAGLVPYSGFSSRDLLAKQTSTPDARVENLEIETRFGTLDTIVWVVPGFFYGYYLWAPRTVAVRGTRVDDAPAVSGSARAR